MMNYLLIAINHGGVIVDKEVIVNVEKEEFTRTFELFKRKNGQNFSTFLTEKELQELAKRFDELRWKRG